MKKIAKVMLVAVFMLVFLTGCYKQDTVVTVGHNGTICAEVALVGTDDSVAQVSGGGTFDELKASLLPQINGMILDTSKEKCEPISEEVNGVKMNGLKFTAYYSSFDEMAESQLFYAYNSSVAVPVTTGEYTEGTPGLTINSENNMWGTTYKVKGTISLTQGQEIIDEELKKLETASANLTFKFPFASFSTSAGNGNIIMPTFSYTATTQNDNIPVDFSVYVPNYFMFLGILLIIILIVIVIIQALKIRKLKGIISGEACETVEEEAFDSETFISKDDEEFFEGSDETVEFTEENTVQQQIAEEETDVDSEENTEE